MFCLFPWDPDERCRCLGLTSRNLLAVEKKMEALVIVRVHVASQFSPAQGVGAASLFRAWPSLVRLQTQAERARL